MIVRPAGRAAKDIFKILLVAALYIPCAKISFLTSFSSNPAGPTPIWVPSGYSIAMILILGEKVWPGIALGALLVDFSLKAPPLTALGLALANTIEPLVAAHLLKRARFNPDFTSLRDVYVVMIAAALISTAASATIGVSVLVLLGPVPIGSYLLNWWDWWVANALSDLILGPFLLAWMRALPWLSFRPKMLAEIVFGSLLGCAVTGFVFFSTQGEENMPFAYWLYPFVIWLAIRVGFRATVTGMLVFSIAAIWSTVIGRGPFVGSFPRQSIAYIQTFLSITAVTGMTMAVVVEELRASLQLRDEFLSIASHELRTPLSALMTQNALINRLISRGSFADFPAEKQRKLIAISLSQLKRLDRLVNDLLEVSRIVAGKMPALREELDLSELVRQVIINLITNAAKYGAGHPVEVRTRRQGDAAIIEVRDYGIGISKEDQERIFGRFERAVSIKSYGGLGLGLYISRQIVDAHGGRIRVESTAGKGATFAVELPLTES